MPSLSDTVRGALRLLGQRLNTDLGQHFLTDDGVLSDIISAANVRPGVRIVEIGAGLGILTRALLATGADVTAIEIDKRWIPFLTAYVASDDGALKRLRLIQGNALEFPFPNEPYAIVANIPYHITSPLLRHAFLESPRPPESLTLLIQREVAERICDTEDGNLLSLIVSLFGKPHQVRRVGASSFLPPPKVESAVLRIDCFATPRVDAATLDTVLHLAKHAFGQKRKMLRGSIGKLPGGAEKLHAVGIDPARRPQTLSTDEWIALARA